MDVWTNAITFSLLAIVLIAAGACDWKTGRIFDWITYPAVVAGLLNGLLDGYLMSGWDGAGRELGYAGLGLAVAFIPCLVLFRLGALGGGDVKLMAAVGAICRSVSCVVMTAFYGLVFAALMALIVMVVKGIFWRTLKTVMAAMLTMASKSAPLLPTDSPRIPIGTAIALGGLLAGGKYLLNIPWLQGLS